MSLDTRTIEDHELAVETPVEEHAADETLVVEELLVEEVSIDGMCGVY